MLAMNVPHAKNPSVIPCIITLARMSFWLLIAFCLLPILVKFPSPEAKIPAVRAHPIGTKGSAENFLLNLSPNDSSSYDIVFIRSCTSGVWEDCMLMLLWHAYRWTYEILRPPSEVYFVCVIYCFSFLSLLFLLVWWCGWSVLFLEDDEDVRILSTYI